jgi:outer membrane protein assembly factor BamB
MNKKTNITLIIICFLFNACSSSLKVKKQIEITERDHFTFAKSNERTNFNPTNISLPLKKIWDYSGPAGISSNQPLVVDSLVIVGFKNGEIYILNLITGKRICKAKMGTPIIGTPVLKENTIFIPIANNDNSLRSYNLRNGKLIWSKKIDGIESALLLENDSLYGSTVKGTVFLVESETGKTIWEYKTKKMIRSSLSCNNDKIFFGCDDGILYALNKKDGKVAWEFPTKAPITASTSVDTNGYIYVGSTDNFMYCLNSSNGELNWKFNSESVIKSGPSIDESSVYFTNLSGDLFALNKHDGSLVWKLKIGNNTPSSPTVSNNYLLVGSFDHNLYIINKFSGEKLSSYSFDGRIVTSPIICGNYILICSEDYDITLFKF